LLRGHIGREGAGLCPVRGHSNVQGDRMAVDEIPVQQLRLLNRARRLIGFHQDLHDPLEDSNVAAHPHLIEF
jgi:anaerobic selenocysteine-containing dehydrogenase